MAHEYPSCRFARFKGKYGGGSGLECSRLSSRLLPVGRGFGLCDTEGNALRVLGGVGDVDRDFKGVTNMHKAR